jgi:hypothetical protein
MNCRLVLMMMMKMTGIDNNQVQWNLPLDKTTRDYPLDARTSLRGYFR